MRLSYLLLAPILALTASAQAIQGCVGVDTVLNPFLTVGSGASVAPGDPLTSSACAAACKDAEKNYAFFFPSPINIPLVGGGVSAFTTSCTCSNTEPTLSQLITATAAVNAAGGGSICGTASPQAIAVKQNLNLRACVSAEAISNTVSKGKVTSVSQCQSQCVASSYAYAIVNTIAQTCSCASNAQLVNGAQTGLCGTTEGANAVYLNNAVAQPSGGLRRRSFERQAVIGLCPTGLQACLVGDDSAVAFECLDTRAELESCGGCVRGYADTTAGASSIGTDCSSLPGVALGGSTCTLGKCEIYACKKGHNLVNGRCLRA